MKQPETQTKESEIELPEETPIIEPSKGEDEMEAVMKGEKAFSICGKRSRDYVQYVVIGRRPKLTYGYTQSHLC